MINFSESVVITTPPHHMHTDTELATQQRKHKEGYLKLLLEQELKKKGWDSDKDKVL